MKDWYDVVGQDKFFAEMTSTWQKGNLVAELYLYTRT